MNSESDDRLATLLDSVSQLETRMQNMSVAPRQPNQVSDLEAAAAEIRARQANLSANGAGQNRPERNYGADVASLHEQIKGQLNQIRGDISNSISRSMPSNLDQELNALRSELANMRNIVASNGRPTSTQKDIKNIMQGMDALQTRMPAEKDDISTLRSEIDDMRAMLSSAAREDTVRQLSDSYASLAGQTANSPTSQDAIMKRLLDQLDSTQIAVESLPSTRHISNVESRIDQLGTHLERTLKEQNQMDSNALNVLEGRLNTINDALHSIKSTENGASNQMVNRLDDRMTELAGLIQAQSNQVSQGHSHFDDVAVRLEQMGDRLDNLMRSKPAETHHFDFLASRIDDMVGRVDALAAASPDHSGDLSSILSQIGQISQHLNSDESGSGFSQIEARLDGIANSIDNVANLQTGRSEADLAPLQAQIQAIAEQIDNAQPQSYSQDMSTMAQNLVALSEKLDNALVNTPENPGLASLESQIAAMHAKLDNLPSNQADAPLNEAATNRIERQISTLAEHLELSTQIPADPSRLSQLETQISNIANLLNETNQKAVAFSGSLDQASGADFSERFERLENQLSSQSDAMLNAAREAALEAVTAGTTGANSDVLIRLAEDLNSLQATAMETNTGTRQTFDAVHTTLEKIVDRLEGLEVQNPKQSEAPRGEAARETVLETADDGAAGSSLKGFNPLLNVLKGSDNAQNQSMPAATEPNFADLPQVASPSVEPAIPAPNNDKPLEPGTTPDFSNMKPAPRAKAATPDAVAGEGMDFIAAARRAAKAAADETAHAASQAPISADKAPDVAAPTTAANAQSSSDGLTKDDESKTSGLGKLRTPVIIASAAVLLAIAAFKFGPTIGQTLLGDKEIAQTEVETPATPNAGSESAMATPSAAPAVENSAPAASKQIAKIPSSGPIANPTLDKVGPTIAATGDNVTNSQSPVQGQTQVATTNESGFPSEKVGPPELRQAAANGNPAAMFEVGLRFTEGKLVTKDTKEAAKWYSKAATQGLAPAQYRLGNFFEKGLGVEQNYDTAVLWYQKAADSGNARAMHNLAVLHTEEVGGGRQIEKATELFRQAADLGIKDSQFNLGIMYGRGLGVDLDLKESYKWFALAARSGDKEAANKRDQVANAMLPEDLDKARINVEAWTPKSLNKTANTVSIPAEWSGKGRAKTAQAEVMSAPEMVSSMPVNTLDVVRDTQQALLQMGYKIGSADGKAGRKTISAIRDFQKQIGLPVDGKPSVALLQAMRDSNI